MSASVWAEDTTLPLTSRRDGTHIYVSATPLPLTAAQAREAAGRLLDHADAIERGDPHAGAVQRFENWKARQAGHECCDCTRGEAAGPCVCQLAERPNLTSEQAQKLEVLR